VRVLIAFFLMLTGCSSLLGITDPVAGQPGDDGGVPDPDSNIDAGPRTLVSIAIAPDPLALPLGITKPLQVIGTFSDTSTEDLTAQSTFALDSGTAVSVSPAGVVRALAQGQATLSASFEAFSDTIDATVGPPEADRLLLSLGNISISQQQRVQVRARVVFTDGSQQDGTNSVTWTSNNTSVATVVAGRVDAQLVAGDATITASAAGVQPVSLIATVSILVCHPVINEVQSGSSAAASDEWAEIYNPCTVPIDVNNWTLNYRASTGIGATDTNFLITLVGTLAPGELRLYGGNGVPETLDDSWGGGVMQQNNGALGLRSGPTSVGPLVDAMAYGVISAGHPFVEGTASAGLVNGTSLSRLPFDGNDTNDGGTNFAVTTISTPHVLNAP
jgi:hypothetical protein